MVTDCLYSQVQSQVKSVGWALWDCQVVGMALAKHQHIQDKDYNTRQGLQQRKLHFKENGPY